MSFRVGIYPGTFDPIHMGHLAFAREALRVCELDKVIFLPEPKPRGKNDVTDISHRIALIEQTILDLTGFRILSLLSEQFTVKETLPELRNVLRDTQLTFLLGSDIVRTFQYRWEGLEVLFNEVSFAIGLRTDDDPEEITEIMKVLAQEYNTTINYVLIDTAYADVASSKIRGGIIDGLYPTTAEYIRQHSLYSKD